MAAALLVAFLVVPLAEIYVIVQVGQAIGGWQTFGLLVVWSALGAWLVKREGRRAWQAFRGAAEAGRIPTREVADGALVVVGGALLLTPGFITDVVGLLLVLPFTRPASRRLLTAVAARRATKRVGPIRVGGWPGSARRPYRDGGVIDGEVVDAEVVDGEVLDRRSGRPRGGHGSGG